MKNSSVGFYRYAWSFACFLSDAALLTQELATLKYPHRILHQSRKVQRICN